MTLSRQQRGSKHSQPHSCMKVTDASQSNIKDDDDRVKKSMKQKNSATSNLKALKVGCTDSELHK